MFNPMTAVKKMTVGQAFRMVTTASAAVVVVWGASKPFVHAWAADAFVQMLEQNGMNPADFAKMKEQGLKNGKTIDEVSQDVDKIKEKVTGIGSAVNDIGRQIEAQNKSIDKVEDLVNKLLTIQLQRADFSSSPPGTGPVGLPKLGQIE